jgi:glycosyltransferase involved in cell wall biosynthesis
MTRIAFIIPDLKNGWLGGANYFRNLLWAISSVPESDFEIFLFLGKKVSLDSLGEIPDCQVVRSRLFDRMSLAWLVRKATFRLAGSDIFLDRFLQRHGISVLSHSHSLGKKSKVKTIGWIPDFQHRHLPDFFSKKECELRDKQFKKLLANCDHVIVSSESAYRDLQRFYIEYSSKVSVLRFAVRQPDAFQNVSLSDLESLYGFEGEYIYIPNQFWVHKNHSVIVESIAALGGRAPLCILTGATEDYRHPDYFSELMKKVYAAGVQDKFRVLGIVPYDHVVSLMSHARLLLNPSLFEGWSTTVEEAKALGKPMLLSDIPVHREQAPRGTLFFPAKDSIALAENINIAFGQPNVSGSSKEFAIAATERFQLYGASYCSIVFNILKSD